MKKILVILVMVCAVSVVQAQTKVGHINSSELIDKMPEADSIQTVLLKEQEQWQSILAEKENEAKTKYAALMELADDPNVSNSVKEVKAQEVENLQQQYQDLQKRASESLQTKQTELLTPLLDTVKKTIAEVAKANGYAYVMDTTEGSGIIYSDESYDLMPLVKAKLGIN